MQGSLLTPLAAWQTFYQIVGSAAATLTGLMFIVITLIAGRQLRVPTPGEGIAVYSTPTVVYFGTALLIAALFSAPWPVLWPVSLVLGLAGLGGVIYIFTVLHQARHHQRIYQPVLEDWLWHTILPLIAYLAFVATSLLLLVASVAALFISATGTVLLLFIGIHNAWDNVTYLTIQQQTHVKARSQDQEERLSL